ncbi:hypothetical protein AAC387_Pa09g1856 [Persea americana]
MSAMNKLFCTFCYYMLFLALAIRTAMGQAPAPAPAGQPNITAILEKAGKFNMLIRLMTTTKVANQINNELNDTNDAMTIFAPTDAAFSALPSGTLNSLKDHEKSTLLQFHIVPQFILPSQLQTVSNPLRTHAGDVGTYGYPLNIITSGNMVNITTGVDNATITGTVHSDGQLAVYEVDNVLLPMAIYGSKPPTPATAPAPAPAKPKKAASAPMPPAIETSGDMGLRENVVVALVVAVVGVLWL